MTTVSDMLSEIGDVRNNPAGIQRVMLNTVEAMLGGDYDVLDPSNPFVFLMEAGAVVGAAGIMRNEVNSRRQYPSLAQTEDELYNHMVNDDYADRFASPARTTFTFLLSLDEIKQRVIDDGTGVKKMVIPRDTEIVVEGMSFTMQYPVEIRVMPHGGVQVVYDVSILSPLQVLESNLLNWKTAKMPSSVPDLGDLTMLVFEVPMYQFKIKDHYDQLSKSSGFTKTYVFEDQFYYCRVYTSKANEEWVEINTTHSDMVYDPNSPTALLKVVENELTIKIPQIYFTTDQVGRGVRIDIYTTKGAVEMALERYRPNDFSANWRDLAKTPSAYLSPIQSFSTMTMLTTQNVTGGRDKLSFDELRTRVINNALGAINIPITPMQLQVKMDTLGYKIEKEIDNITNRLYLATREIPAPSSGILGTGIGCTITTLQSNIESLRLIQTVRDNGDRITIESGTLFEIDQGILKIVDNSVLDAIATASAESKVQMLDSGRYVYTPYHYVFDTNNNRFDVRPYYLDHPVISSKRFMSENQTTRLEVATDSYGIGKTDTGYIITVKTRSGDVFRGLEDTQVYAQLSYLPPGEVDRAYLNGTLIGRDSDDEYIFEFDITSEFDVDENDRLQITPFRIYDGVDAVLSVDLAADIDIVYAVSNYTTLNMEHSSIDKLTGDFLLPSDAIAVIHEQLNVKFGDALTGLWSRARTVAGAEDYLTYDADEPAVYTETVYARDPLTGHIDISYDGTDITYTVLHNAGDPVLDGDGNPTYAHLAGDTKLDNDGNPIPVSSKKIMRQADLMLFEGPFAYVTESSVQSYVTEMVETIVNWVTNDISTISNQLLENTSMWFYPATTFGNVDAYVENGVLITTSSEQSFTVKYYLSDAAYANTDLREDLNSTVIEVISSALKNKTISITDIATTIKAKVGNDVINVSVSGLGGTDNYEVMSLRQDSSRLNIRKKPIVLPDGRITVQDDVTVEFIKHFG